MKPDEPPPSNPAVVRDHLANERTFLAWVRTGIGLIGFGFVLARVGMFLRNYAAVSATPRAASVRAHLSGEFMVSGIAFLLIGTVLCGWAGRVYGKNRRAIEAGRFEAAGASVLALSGLVVVGGLVITAMVLWGTVVAFQS